MFGTSGCPYYNTLYFYHVNPTELLLSKQPGWQNVNWKKNTITLPHTHVHILAAFSKCIQDTFVCCFFVFVVQLLVNFQIKCILSRPFCRKATVTILIMTFFWPNKRACTQIYKHMQEEIERDTWITINGKHKNNHRHMHRYFFIPFRFKSLY